MTEAHRAVTIVPTGDLAASEAFYKRLGFAVESDYGDYRILADGRGWHLHLNKVDGWPRRIEGNPLSASISMSRRRCGRRARARTDYRAGRASRQALGHL